MYFRGMIFHLRNMWYLNNKEFWAVAVSFNKFKFAKREKFFCQSFYLILLKTRIGFNFPEAIVKKYILYSIKSRLFTDKQSFYPPESASSKTRFVLAPVCPVLGHFPSPLNSSLML